MKEEFMNDLVVEKTETFADRMSKIKMDIL